MNDNVFPPSVSDASPEEKKTSVPVSSEPLRGKVHFAVTRPVAVLMLSCAIIVFGYVSYKRLPLNLMPDMSYPTLTVRTEYNGAPADLEELISKPIEQTLGVTNNLVHIYSISRAGVSDVVLEFSWGTDMDESYQSIREKLGQVFLPKEASKPLLLRYDPSLDPILRLGLYGHANEFEMRRIAEEEIKRRIESLGGIAAVRVKGGLEEEILVEVNPTLMEKYKIDINLILQRLREENLNIAAGSLKEAETEYLVRSINQFKSLEEIRNLVIAKKQDQKIRMSDIGSVRLSNKKREVITRINQKNSVEIAIYKEGDANLVRVADSVKMVLFGTTSTEKISEEANSKESKTTDPHEENTSNNKSEKKSESPYFQKFVPIVKQLPKDFHLDLLSDQSVFIKKAIDEVKDTAIVGVLLAIAILFVFLKKFTVTLIIGMSIPISIVATFAPMYIYEVSLNIMSLGGLALGAGMLVDNSIVVLEAIARRREEGEDFVTSAILGTEEVFSAVVASTLTTVCVFFPIAFVEGVAGQIFKDQALTVVFSLLASLIVALFLIPMLMTRRFQKIQTQKISWFQFHSWNELRRWFSSWKRWKFIVLSPFLISRFLLYFLVECLGKLIFFSIVFVFFLIALSFRLFGKICRPFLNFFFFLSDKGIHGFHQLYTRLLRVCLHHPYALLFPIILLFGMSLYVFPSLGKELIPKVSQGEFTIEVYLPIGTPLEKTDQILIPLEKKAAKEAGIALVSSNVGVQKDSISSSDEGEHTGKIFLRMIPGQFEQEDRIIQSLNQQFLQEPELSDVKVSYPSIFSFKTPVEIEIRGYNLQVLKNVTQEVVNLLKNIDGFYNVRSSVKRGNPEIQIQYNREFLAQYKLNIDDISNRIKNFMGTVSTRYQEQDKSIDILVQLENLENLSVEELENLIITPGENEPKRLKDVAQISRVEGFSEIRRINQQRAALISASLSGVSLSDATEQLRKKLESISLPSDFEFIVGGQNKEMEVSLNSLKFALMLAVFLVYIVLASQFESLLHPFIIIASLPLALVGVIFTLYWLTIPLSIIVYIGFILLVGIVVNNAIVLIDCINQQIAQKLPLEEAIIRAGTLRLRPILMTTLTTILGLLPMTGWIAFGSGEGEEIRAPMAITVISGLASSTLLTLIVIPVIYSLFEKTKRAFGFSSAS